MNRALLDVIIAEYEEYREPLEDPELEAVGVAILLEDTLGIVLNDAQITPALLGGPSALRRLLAQSMPPA